MALTRSSAGAALASPSGQLDLALPLGERDGLGRAALPPLPIAAEWKDQQRLWGHSFHPMCSYLASFPASLAHAFIARYSRPGDVVLDPFAGRGTVPLQAAAEGRIGVGNDLNPFAWLLTAAKVEAPSEGAVRARLAILRVQWALHAAALTDGGLGVELGAQPGDNLGGPPALAGADGAPSLVRIAFAPTTLAQILFLRRSLRLDDPADRFLAAATAGILHGRTGSYLSTLMPNQFALAPAYVRRQAERTGYVAPDRDVFVLLDRKLTRLFRQPPPAGRGIALLGDARDAGSRATAALRERRLPDLARLVVTSPPYLRVLRYERYNWLRSWFLGFDGDGSGTPGGTRTALDDGHRREPYLTFLRDVLADLRHALADDAVVVIVLGDVERDRGRVSSEGRNLAADAWEAAAEPEGYRLAGAVADPIAPGRKMTALWGARAGRATSADRILVLGASESGRRRALAGAGLPLDWEWPPRRLRAL